METTFNEPTSYSKPRALGMGEVRQWMETTKDTCYDLIHCGCNKGCSGRYKCIKANLQCTALCLCGGDCELC